MKSSQGVETNVRRKRRKDTSTADKMEPIVVADFENHNDGREFKQLQNMNSSQGLKAKVGKNRRQRRNKASNDTEEMKPIVVADFENHTGVKRTSSVGKKKRRKASVGVKEKVEVKMSVDEAELIRRVGSWGHDHLQCCHYREFYMMPHDMVKEWSKVKDLSDEKEMVEYWSQEEVDEEEEELDKMWAAA